MYDIAAKEAFFQELREIDYLNILRIKTQACLPCGNPLDTSNYPRKPRGLGENEDRRFSLCCRLEGCRTRVTPASLRFFGRKVYSSWVVILAIDFVKELGLLGHISRQTIARWKDMWRDRLSDKNPFMLKARGFLLPGLPSCDSPGGFLSDFHFPEKSSWIPILKFFTP